MKPIEFTPHTTAFRANPYPFYDLALQTTPVFYNEKWHGWFCLSYQDCHHLLKANHTIPLLEPDDPMTQYLRYHWVLMENPPVVTRLRRLTHQAFFTQVTDSLPQQIDQFARELLNDISRQKSFDFIADFARPLAIKTMSHVFKLPYQEVSHLSNLGHNIRLMLDLIDDPVIKSQALASAEELSDYAQKLFEADPPSQLISQFKTSLKDEPNLTTTEFYSVCVALLINGLVSIYDFATFMAGGMLALLHHPDQIALLQTKPTLIKSAIREFLRYETPVQVTERLAGQEFELNGQIIETGAHLYLFLGAANRDPNRFNQPHEFNIARYPNPHLAFGGGLRACFGATFMYFIGEAALQALTPHLANLHLNADSFEYTNGFVFRGLHKLPLLLQ